MVLYLNINGAHWAAVRISNDRNINIKVLKFQGLKDEFYLKIVKGFKEICKDKYIKNHIDIVS